ncbi:c-type cytochrome [Roseicella frigidaeris]|uniref:Cytochrome c n=1 Tax=Roseicella frigidaeris TaxID=2230885 RepID=A0A327LX03_9PROT|nr:cytochrome c [Roseicella frigidaeris]RAI55190.1 cytochrome c [Roseicella frigidaeris]
MATLLLAGTARAEVPPERQAELRRLLLHDCGSCHGLTMRGGLGKPLLPETLAGRSDEALAEVILQGVRGTPMPPWREELSAEEARWMVQTLRQGVSHAR